MNKQRILEIADIIEKDTGPAGLKYDQETFGGPTNSLNVLLMPALFRKQLEGNKNLCGTEACIAGWVVAKYDGAEEFLKMLIEDWTPVDQLHHRAYGSENIIMNRATELLELDDDTAEDLFMYSREAPNDVAAIVLRDLAKTGKADWDAAFEKSEEE